MTDGKYNNSTLNNNIIPDQKFLGDLEKYHPKVIRYLISAK